MVQGGACARRRWESPSIDRALSVRTGGEVWTGDGTTAYPFPSPLAFRGKDLASSERMSEAAKKCGVGYTAGLPGTRRCGSGKGRCCGAYECTHLGLHLRLRKPPHNGTETEPLQLAFNILEMRLRPG